MEKKSTFVCESKYLAITDPGWGAKTFSPITGGFLEVNPGKTWNVTVGIDNTHGRNAYILARDSSVEDKSNPAEWSAVEFSIGIETSICGIFDSAIVPDEISTGDDDDPESLIGSAINACKKGEIALSECSRAGRGAVCYSGYGDRVYDIRALKRDDKTIGVFINFIDDAVRQSVAKMEKQHAGAFNDPSAMIGFKVGPHVIAAITLADESSEAGEGE